MGFVDLNNGAANSESPGGGSQVTIVRPTVGFGGVETVQLRPVAQGDFVYGINSQTYVTASFVGGAVSTENGMATVSCGTNASGSAILNLRRAVKYRPGMGSLMRATAIFDTPAADNLQLLGMANEECGYSIGYNNIQFGVMHRESGSLEIRKLTVSAAATNGEQVTVQLDGDSYVFTIAIEGTTSTAQTAYKIACQDFTQIGRTGFRVDAIGSDVYFLSSRCNSTLTGSYAVSGNIGISGSFSRTQAGANYSETFIPQDQFNIDKLNGAGASEMIINPQLGNVYEIDLQYLGFGATRYSIQNPKTGRFFPFHVIENANSRTRPVLKNPNVHIRLESSNAGNTTSRVVKSASTAAFVAGEVIKLDPKFSKSWTFTDLRKLTYYPLALLKANRVHQSQVCYSEFDILRIGASNESASKTLTIGFFKGAKITGPVTLTEVDSLNSTVSYANLDPNGTSPPNTISNLAEITPFYELVVGSESSKQVDLEKLELIFQQDTPVVIAVKTSSSPMAGAVSAVWFEQQ